MVHPTNPWPPWQLWDKARAALPRSTTASANAAVETKAAWPEVKKLGLLMI